MTNKAILANEVAEGVYGGVERSAVRHLQKYFWEETKEDLAQDVKVWALIAVHDYDPSYGCAFNVFLHTRLHQRVLSRLSWATRECRDGARVVREGADRAARSAAPVPVTEIESRLGEDSKLCWEVLKATNDTVVRKKVRSGRHLPFLMERTGFTRGRVLKAMDELKREAGKCW